MSMFIKKSNKSINDLSNSNKVSNNNNEFDILFNNFLTKLGNDNQASFILFVFNNPKVKKYIADFFDSFLVEFAVNKYWFFKNALYLYCFRNNKNDFLKMPISDIFHVFFEQFKSSGDDLDLMPDFTDITKL